MRFAAVALLAAASLLLGAVSAAAVDPIYNPTIQVDARLDEVNSWGWPANAPATLAIDTPASLEDLVVPLASEANGTIHRYTWQIDEDNPLNITPDTTVTIECGDYVKSVRVTRVLASGANVGSDVVTGTAAAGSQVTVEIFGVQNYMPRRVATADSGGRWSVSFATTDTTNPNPDDPSRNPFDIVRGTGGQALQVEGDGDSTRSTWKVLYTRFMVNTSDDRFNGNDWPANSFVTIAVDNWPYGVAAFTMSTWTNINGDFNCATGEGPQQPDGRSFDVQPGAHVTVTSGATSKDTYATSIAVTSVDPDTDSISGTGAGDGGQADVAVWLGWGTNPQRLATADGSGNWSVSFATTDTANPDPFDIGWGTPGGVSQRDIDGDVTEFSWQPAHFGVAAASDRVWGFGFYGGPQVTVTIGAWSTQMDLDQRGNFDSNNLEDGLMFDITPGMHVDVTDGATTKDTTVTVLAVSGADTASDIVTGTAEAGSEVLVCVQEGGWNSPSRHVTTGGNGEWLANFAIAGPKEMTANIMRGSTGWASQSDVEGDETQAYWNVPNAWFGVNPATDDIWGQDWASGPGGEVTITVDDPANGEGVDFTTTAAVDQWGAGFSYNTMSTETTIDITAGMTVRVVSGGRDKSQIVTSVDITGVDIGSSIATGTAAANSAVQVWVNNGPSRYVTASPDGVWSADFANGGEGQGENGTWTFGPGTELTAGQWDEDGDHTVDQWRIPNPYFGVEPANGNIWGNDWEPNSQMTITFDDGDPEVSPDHEMATTVDGDGSFGVGTRDDQGVGFDITAGMIIVITDGVNEKTHTVTEVDITGVDEESDIVTGTAAPESTVQVWVNVEEGESPTRNVTATVDGVWTADFAHMGEGDWGGTWEVGPGSSFTAMQADEDGDHTVDYWRIPNPRIWVDPEQDAIGVIDFLPNAPVDVLIEDLTTEKSPDATATAQSDDSGGVYFDNLGDITGDCFVTASDGTNTKSLDVAPLSVTSVDILENSISGTADPNASLDVGFNEGYWGPQVVAGPDGTWTRDFDDITEVEIHLEPGHEGQAIQRDEDGDQTQVDWHARAPLIEVGTRENWLEGHDWVPGEPVLVTVDDPVGADFVDTAIPDWEGYIGLWDTGYDVQAGQTVTFSDGNTTKILQVTALTVDGWNMDADTVWGTAEPFGNVSVDLWDVGEDSPSREDQADENGYWIVDFTVAIGDEPWQQGFEFMKGLSGRARETDFDGDQTSDDWHIPNPRFTASPAEDVVWGSDWTPNTTMTVTIDASGTAVGVDATYTTQSGENGDFGFGWPGPPMGGEVNAGDIITVTDGVITKTHVVTDLAITSLDRNTGFIVGTAEPNSWFGAWWDGEGGGQRQAGPEGNWRDEWTGGTPFPPGASGHYEQVDEDGDSTFVGWAVPNAAPVASDVSTTTAEDTAKTIDVLAASTDVDSGTLTLSAVTQGAHGTVAIVAGKAVYTPAANWHGTDSFDYTVSDGSLTDTGTVAITVNSVNDGPPVASDVSTSTAEDTAKTVDVVAASTDVDGDTLTLSAVTQGTHGSVAIVAGMAVYTPAADWNGTDSFTYTVSDGTLTDAGNVTITVASANDAPVAAADTYSTPHNTALVVAAPGVLTNDTDVDANALVAVKVSDPSHGAVTLSANGSFTYTPTTGSSGADSFTYKASDGTADSGVVTVTITVAAANAPAATMLSLAASVAAPKYDAAVTLSATLLSNGTALGGQTVVFERLFGSTWISVGNALSDANGVAVLTIKPHRRAKTTYRARFDATSAYAASTSPVVIVKPKVYLTKPNAPRTMYKGKAKAIAGYLKTKHTAGTYPVRIYKYRLVSGKWKSYGYVKAKASNYSTYTKYTKTFSLPYAGKWRLRAVAPADSKHAKTYSSYDYVTVK